MSLEFWNSAVLWKPVNLPSDRQNCGFQISNFILIFMDYRLNENSHIQNQKIVKSIWKGRFWNHWKPYKCKCSNIELAGQSSTVAEANDKRLQKWDKILSEGAFLSLSLFSCPFKIRVRLTYIFFFWFAIKYLWNQVNRLFTNH